MLSIRKSEVRKFSTILTITPLAKLQFVCASYRNSQSLKMAHSNLANSPVSSMGRV